jgi:hypothetical protein
MTTIASAPILFDLSADRKIVFRQRGSVFTLSMRPPTQTDWFAYFDAVVTTAEQRGRDVVRSTDAGAAGLDLVEKLLVDAGGYPLPEGATDILQVEEWRSAIPLSHRLTALELLLDVRAIDTPDDDPLVFKRETVFLQATWSADEKGNMFRLQGLKHVFETPSADHYRTYMSQISRSKVVGGSRNGKTVYSGAQRVLCTIYDDLIREVSGYRAGVSENLMGQVMDARHKVAAAERLFASAETEN